MSVPKSSKITLFDSGAPCEPKMIASYMVDINKKTEMLE